MRQSDSGDNHLERSVRSCSARLSPDRWVPDRGASDDSQRAPAVQRVCALNVVNDLVLLAFVEDTPIVPARFDDGNGDMCSE